jgi:Carboxypeptidase regulatory-like domain
MLRLNSRCSWLLFVVSFFCALFPVSRVGLAQNAQGTLLGHVTDPSGAVLVGAKVTALNEATNVIRTYTTNNSGEYVFVNLDPGVYRVTVEAEGFSKENSADLTLQVEQTLRQDFHMAVGTASTEVTVTSEGQMLQTDNITTGQVIEGKVIENTPLNGRDFTNLLQIGVGTTITPGGIQRTGFVAHGLNTDNGSGSGGFQEVSINGAHADSISYSIDGINDTDFFFSAPTNIPGELAIEEFKIENGQYGAMGGQGSVQVNVAIKSGTNSLHGAAYDFIQNDAFNPDDERTIALNQLNGTNNPTKLPFKQNQFGGTLGGPVVVPHLYNGKDKTFWFFSYDGGRRHASTAPQGLVTPSAQEFTGDFSDWPFPIYDPTTTGQGEITANNPFGRRQFSFNGVPNKIDPSRLSSTALALAKYFNNVNVPSCSIGSAVSTGCNNYNSPVLNRIETDKESFRIDQNFGQDHIFFTGLFSREDDLNPSIVFGQSGKTIERSRLFGLTWTHTVNSNLINQATLGYNRQHFFTGQTTGGGPDLSTAAGFANTPQIPAYFDIPNIHFSNFYHDIGGASPYEQWDNVYQGVDTVTLVRGRHTLNFGIDFRRVNLKDRDSYGAMGTVNFNGEYTASDPSAAGSLGPNAGNPFADFLLGQVQSGNGPPPLGSDLYWLWGNNYNLFAQDDIHVTSRLNMNLGLRWERPTSFHSIHNSGYAFDPTGQGRLLWADQSFVSPILAAGGNPNYLGCCVSNQLVHLDKKDFAPRIGFSYRPPLSDRLVVRGGYGLFYDTYNRFYDGTQFDENSLLTLNAAPILSGTGAETASPIQLDHLWRAPLTAVSAFSLPSYEANFGQVYWPGNHNPYNQQYSLGFQYELKPSLLLDANYVGSHGVHEETQLLINVAFLPKVAGDSCNNLLDASLATGSNAACASDPSFQPIDTRQIWSNLPPSLYANANLLSSSYNSLQLQLIQRPIHGLQYHLNYTWSKSLDETSGVNNVKGENNLLQDPHNIGANYGLAASDETHRVVATYVYELPAGTGHLLNVQHLNWLIGGWTTSGIYQIGSGFPFAVMGGVQQDQTSNNNWPGRYLANSTFVHSSSFHKSLSRYFDTSMYSTPQLGTYGNSGKAPERTPYFTNFDASFGKIFAITERQQVKFRAEIFNLGSTWHSSVNLLSPDSTVTDANFGSLLTSTNPAIGNKNLFSPHTIQMGLQYTF